MSPSVMSWVKGQGDLNRSNRPVRIRMPGGVGGERSCLIAPYPDFTACFFTITRTPLQGVCFTCFIPGFYTEFVDSF